MRGKVAVVGATPTWRRGMSVVLDEAGYATVELAELAAWTPGRGGRAVVAAVGDQTTLDDIRGFGEEHPHIPVIAVLPNLDVGSFAETVRAGATVAVAEHEPPEAFVTALEAAIQGWAAVPGPVLRAMASRIPSTPDPSAWVTDDEAQWLRALADGMTVADLAAQVGYSEREMFRMLRDTYTRLGVGNRTEAIIWATRHGLLHDEE